jgi:hypothetical protein
MINGLVLDLISIEKQYFLILKMLYFNEYKPWHSLDFQHWICVEYRRYFFYLLQI